ncbi:aldolase/citrate lyase family protein [Williamsia sp. CHRR-6]|uniref:DUF6986 family protein n=1 Tax=Williamsia sp. CHRR-6 TaxID=2835871 RepID=UPI001BDB60DA|nr:aldolase/citrate lyase family protein [Williamsia sp. CHRR-6]MBT0568203.1 aldolase [Williamsia sp. CHRR-6]
MSKRPSGVRFAAAADRRLDAILAETDAALTAQYPDRSRGVQPLHTVYVSADVVHEGTVGEWSQRAIEIATGAMDVLVEMAPVGAVRSVLAQLETAPIVDLRVDLEDGYGSRSDEVEDAHARAAGAVLAAWAQQRAAGEPGLYPTIAAGVRCKGLGPVERRRGLRSLEAVLDGAGGVPEGFVFTVPKLRAVGQVDAVLALCEEIERAHGLSAGVLRFELQIESPQAVVGADGTATVAAAIHRSGPRLTGLHYGTYDYSAACGVVAAQQSLEHPLADHAKAVMVTSAAQTGVWVSDGSTQVVPVGDAEQIATALRRHHRLVRRSLDFGVYQGWDMHPGHLITRWLATQSFFADAMPAAATRLQRYLAAEGGESGGVIDEPATARALAAVLVRGWAVNAFDEQAVATHGDALTPAHVAALASGSPTP